MKIAVATQLLLFSCTSFACTSVTLQEDLERPEISVVFVGELVSSGVERTALGVAKRRWANFSPYIHIRGEWNTDQEFWFSETVEQTELLEGYRYFIVADSTGNYVGRCRDAPWRFAAGDEQQFSDLREALELNYYVSAFRANRAHFRWEFKNAQRQMQSN